MADSDKGYNAANFKEAPYAVSYGGAACGGTDGPPTLKVEYKTKDVTCNQAQGRILKKVVLGINYQVTAKFVEPNAALANVFGLTGEITTADLGKDLYAEAKVLELQEIGGTDKITLHAATATVSDYSLDGENLHSVSITFDSTENGDASGKIFTRSASGSV